MIKYAITGNIASGKSVVQKILQEHGEIVLDADIVGHNLLKNNREVVKIFKDYDILDCEEISREKLGEVVFNNKEMLEKLNSVMHPKIRTEIENFFEQNKSRKRVFVGIPLLFESNMQDMFDKVVFIYADDELRLERLMSRNGYTKEYALKRIQSQIPQEEKLNKSDIILKNNNTIERFTDEIIKTLCV